jgi:hypothetical protein
MSCRIFGNRIFGKDSRILVGIWQKKLFLGWFWFVGENNFLNLGKIVGKEKNSLNPLKIAVSVLFLNLMVLFMYTFYLNNEIDSSE